MGYRKVTDNIVGGMAAAIRGILSRVIEMVMVCGLDVLLINRIIKVTTCLIKKMDMVFMIGLMDTAIRVILLTINVAEKDNSSCMKN